MCDKPTDENVVIIEERVFRSYLSALRQAADDVRALQAELHAIGAIKTEDGGWLYPFYLDGEDRYLPRDMWIAARKDIGKHVQVMPRDGNV